MSALTDKLGKWFDYFDKDELAYILKRLYPLYNNPDISIVPNSHDIFKAFEICDVDKVNVIMLGQDVYPQKNIATGIAFGNKAGTLKADYSPSLLKLLEPYEIDDTFDCTLESWCKQGVLLLNSALTCECNKPNSHSNLWRYFISQFLTNYSTYKKDIAYVLFGKNAQNLRHCIKNSATVTECNHPSYLVRTNKPMPNIYQSINSYLLDLNKPIIRWV